MLSFLAFKETDTPAGAVIPQEVAEHVKRKYGQWARRVMLEKQDPCFCNPLVGASLKDGTVFNRMEEFWVHSWSVSSPEDKSLTQFYRGIGAVVETPGGFRFAWSRKDCGGAGAASGE